MGVKLFDRKFGRGTASELPAAPGIYLFRDAEGAVLYVGKAVNLRRRLAGYRNASRRKAHRKMRTLVRAAASLEVRVHPSERDALLEENRLIQALRPPFNVDGAYSFLYPAIGLSAHGGQDLLGFTTDLSAWGDLDFAWYGAFRSRPRAKEAFDVLVEVLSLLAHREPRSRLPRAARPRGSRLVGFRQMSPELRRHLGAYLGGHSSDALVHFAHALLEKPRARRDSERVEELLKALSAFFDSDLRKLRHALSAAGVDGSFIAQEERDPLFIRTARRDAERPTR